MLAVRTDDLFSRFKLYTVSIGCLNILNRYLDSLNILKLPTFPSKFLIG